MQESREDLLVQLKNMFDEKNIISDLTRLISYSTDSSMIKGSALFVVFPQNVEELRRLVLWAKRKKIVLVPRGGGSSLSGGAVSFNSVVVDFSRMSKIIEFDKNNNTIIVQPGVVLGRLNNYLSNFGLFFPVVLDSENICTMGGMVATNASGNYEHKYGKMMNNVIEVEFMSSDGKTTKTTESFIYGSEGLLGLILSIKLKLSPILSEKSLTIYSSNKLEELFEQITKFRVNPFVSRINIIDKKISSLIDFENKYHLIVEFDDYSGDISDLDEIKQLYDKLKELNFKLYEKGFTRKIEPYVLSENISKIIDWCEMQDVPFISDALSGYITVFLTNDLLILDRLANVVLSNCGKISGKYGFGILFKKYSDENIISKINRYKQIYDSDNIFNKGKIFGSVSNFDV